MRLLTVTEHSHFSVRMNCCPMCWRTHEVGDQVVWPGKGFEAICLDCAQSVAAMGRTTSCVRCRRTFTPIRSSATYCSGACRQAAHRARSAAPAESSRNAEVDR